MNGYAILIAACAMCCFAGNSLLSRAAIGAGEIDAVTFSLLRLVSGAAALVAVQALRCSVLSVGNRHQAGSGAALALYTALFSLAYTRIDAGVGAMILFASIQVTMFTANWLSRHRPTRLEWCGISLAVAGLAALTLPGKSAPDLPGAVMMAGAGAASGIWSLRGQGSRDAVGDNMAIFSWAALMLAPLAWLNWSFGSFAPPSAEGIALATISGVVTSAFGYSLWYFVLPKLGRTRAATLQLVVPVLAAAGGVVFLTESVTLRLLISGILVLGGVGLTLARRKSI